MISQSYALMSLISAFSLAAITLGGLGMGAGIRTNPNVTLHPYHFFSTWRYGLGIAVTPVVAMVLTWMFRAESSVVMMDTLHKIVSIGNCGWMIVVVAYEGFVVLAQCDDTDGVYPFKHPQCANRNEPTDTQADMTWIFMFVSLCINAAASIFWVVCSFSISASEAYTSFQVLNESDIEGKIPKGKKKIRNNVNTDSQKATGLSAYLT